MISAFTICTLISAKHCMTFYRTGQRTMFVLSTLHRTVYDVVVNGMDKNILDINYIVVFTESCIFTRINTCEFHRTLLLANDVIADVVDVSGNSMLTEREQLSAHHDIVMYTSDMSSEFTRTLPDVPIVVNYHELHTGREY
jgi:uncharacterized protein YvpB